MPFRAAVHPDQWSVAMRHSVTSSVDVKSNRITHPTLPPTHYVPSDQEMQKRSELTSCQLISREVFHVPSSGKIVILRKYFLSQERKADLLCEMCRAGVTTSKDIGINSPSMQW